VTTLDERCCGRRSSEMTSISLGVAASVIGGLLLVMLFGEVSPSSPFGRLAVLSMEVVDV
jgi:hypothetical protein